MGRLSVQWTEATPRQRTKVVPGLRRVKGSRRTARKPPVRKEMGVGKREDSPIGTLPQWS